MTLFARPAERLLHARDRLDVGAQLLGAGTQELQARLEGGARLGRLASHEVGEGELAQLSLVLGRDASAPLDPLIRELA